MKMKATIEVEFEMEEGQPANAADGIYTSKLMANAAVSRGVSELRHGIERGSSGVRTGVKSGSVRTKVVKQEIVDEDEPD